jgi:hypothetical protein
VAMHVLIDFENARDPSRNASPNVAQQKEFVVVTLASSAQSLLMADSLEAARVEAGSAVVGPSPAETVTGGTASLAKVAGVAERGDWCAGLCEAKFAPAATLILLPPALAC